jgi:hypothetical protein
MFFWNGASLRIGPICEQGQLDPPTSDAIHRIWTSLLRTAENRLMKCLRGLTDFGELNTSHLDAKALQGVSKFGLEAASSSNIRHTSLGCLFLLKYRSALKASEQCTAFLRRLKHTRYLPFRTRPVRLYIAVLIEVS